MRDAAVITNELIASGLSQAQTALLMELVLSMSTGLSTGQGSENRALEKRRAWDRNRKAEQREARRLSALSTGSPPDSTGSRVENADVCTDEEEKNRSLQGKTKKENKKGSRLQSSARISDEFRTAAIDSGCPPDRVDELWTEFVDYWSDIPGQKGCKLSWLGTWRNRVKHLFQKAGNGNATSQNRTDTAAGRATARELDQVAVMGGAGLRYLQERKSAGAERNLSDSARAAEVLDFGERTKNAG